MARRPKYNGRKGVTDIFVLLQFTLHEFARDTHGEGAMFPIKITAALTRHQRNPQADLYLQHNSISIKQKAVERCSKKKENEFILVRASISGGGRREIRSSLAYAYHRRSSAIIYNDMPSASERKRFDSYNLCWMYQRKQRDRAVFKDES